MISIEEQPELYTKVFGSVRRALSRRFPYAIYFLRDGPPKRWTKRSMTAFRDHFSALAGNYARYRPGYPAALFEYLADLAPSHRKAWDCATGSGQAALGLAAHFESVVATDASAEQLAAAEPISKVVYRVAPAERSGLEKGSVDLVTVAQALHWFDVDRFYTEVRRVLAPGGVIAVWCYNLLSVDEAVDAVIDRLYSHVLEPYWPLERRFVENGYRGLPFPFREIEPLGYSMEAHWDLARLLGYLNSWSATNRFTEATRRDAVEEIRRVLEDAWGDPSKLRRVCWPLTLRIGRFE
ncbi:class I SAM-dependent methyltransferase [Thiohalomonas denitrificans]|uniref:class I SAM-dependent methyltransferase n=1 Tax=Thiohalomonas denitrificans TaxID=415747 RepID=UPI0026EE9FDF|nr:class I SAM-dependent methyltransferase [Thiohalomonas denitrificans]